MAPQSDAAATILDTALRLAETQGWRGLTLATIAAESGQDLGRVFAEFPNKPAILAAFNRRIDAQILTEPLDPDSTVRERLFELMMRRFDALGPYRPAIAAILRDTVGDPLAALAGLCAVHRSMSLTLEAAGVSASGPFGRLRAKALGALYLKTLYQWLRHDGGDDRIMAELDRALARAERFATSFSEGRRRRGGRTEPSDVEAESASVAETSEQSG